ncbi:putative bifunctional diguanylate cyclase/phosphodiesterase [Thioalkalivibrio denitrificans]|uniref:putative bifunctional diguanylate cyclase/phosphodiesterase n=1 Tax=Thioalkalivibrio denitrificans TaxID=108003 RepID=UPI001C37A549|nr:EAL domain-containing protein [Thioalkalivibrio denitrificans]
MAVVHLQSGAAAYLSGESIWSRAQLSAVRDLDRYARTGDPAYLKHARAWLDVPLGDLDARKAMEAPTLDYKTAREGLLRGQIHPDDVPGMIRLFRHFSEAPYFRDAVQAWRDSDPYILELAALADRLQAEWETGAPSPARLAQSRMYLVEINLALERLSQRFRTEASGAARWMTRMLSVASVLFLLTLAGLTGLLGWRLTRALTSAERKFRTTFEQAAVGMALVAQDGRLLDVNRALCNILCRPKEAVLGQPYPAYIHAEDQEIARAQWEELISDTRENDTVEQRLHRGDGDTVWVKLTISSMREDSRHGPRFIAIIEDVSESRRLSLELDYQANHDALTGLPNRRAFERRLAETLRRARADGSAHALCFIDLDQFKIVNDTSGHVAGDELLRQAADLLRRSIREHDLLARLGGDEFAIILQDCDLGGAARISEKLRKALEGATFAWEDSTFSLGCSIGVVPITAASTDTGSLLRAADIACHLAKEKGRNRVHLLCEDDRQLAERRGEMEWMGRIRAALRDQRMFLDAQRLVCLARPEHLRYEVLVRLTDETGKVVPPGAFLPAAERFGAAHLVDRWVIEHVCARLAAHPEHLAALDACHINLSGRSFDQADFFHFVVDRLEHYGVPGEKICFEITETAAARNLVDVIGFMDRLASRGCTFALDDFGSGLSSFGYLRRLPVDCLKIDGTFVRDIARDATDRAMVRAINEIGQTLGKTIVAEFVESDEALELLKDMGVHFAQGYAVHRPCRFDEILNDGHRRGVTIGSPQGTAAAAARTRLSAAPDVSNPDAIRRARSLSR